MVVRELEQLDIARARELLDRGRSQFDERNFAEASSLFRQALEIRPSPDSQQLFDRARDELLAEFRANEDAETRRTVIASNLSRARELESGGSFSESVDRLQPVLAADPENREALSLQRTILASQREWAYRDAIEEELG